MINHKWSIVGFMLWFRYGLLRLKFNLSTEEIYSQYLESYGTKAYSVSEGYQLFSSYKDVSITTVLTHGDLLSSVAGQRHHGILFTFARKIWPRKFIRKYLSSFGLFMLIDARKK